MNREEILYEINKYLQDVFHCTDSNLNDENIIFTVNKKTEEPFIQVLICGKSIVVNTSAGIHTQIKKVLRGKNRDEIFEMPLIYGQTIHYIPDVSNLTEAKLPEGYTYMLLQGEEINKLSHITGFDNSLVFDEAGKTSTQIVFAAYKDDLVIAIAGAGAVTDKLWEVGIDVNPSCRNNGLATALTRKLTLEIMRQGIVPFYSASITNVGSQMVAQRAGYIPYWIDSFGNIFDKNYAYDYEAVIKAIKKECEVCK